MAEQCCRPQKRVASSASPGKSRHLVVPPTPAMIEAPRSRCRTKRHHRHAHEPRRWCTAAYSPVGGPAEVPLAC